MNSCKNSKCLRNKVLKTLGYVRNFTYLGAANITSKQKSDMTKVAIKNENITSFGGIYHIVDVFSKLGFEKLTESVLGRRGCSGKAFSYGSILSSLFFSYLCVKIVQKISMRLQDSSIRVLAHCYLMLTLPILNIYQDLQ